MKLGFIISLLVFSLFGSLYAQEVAVIKFPELKEKMSRESEIVYVFNFWATWCKPCVAELPYFEKLTATYNKDQLVVVLVSLDFASQLDRKVVPFVKEKQLKSEVVLLDAPNYNEWIDKINPKWSGAIPATVIIHGESKTNQFYEQQFTYTELEDIVRPLLKL